MLRIEHHAEQSNHGTPAQVFPLLCPVREADWVPGWEYRIVHSATGVAELGCVFTTPAADGSEQTWICVEYAPPHSVAYVWVWPQMATAFLRITLEPNGDMTKARISYQYTALSPEGERELARYTAAWFQAKMAGGEKAVNHYLRTGVKLNESHWE